MSVKISLGKSSLEKQHKIDDLKHRNSELIIEIQNKDEKCENLETQLKNSKEKNKLLSGKISCLEITLTDKNLTISNLEKEIFEKEQNSITIKNKLKSLEEELYKEREINQLLINDKKMIIDNNFEMLKKSKEIKNQNKNIFSIYEKSSSLNKEYEQTIKDLRKELENKANFINALLKERDKKNCEVDKLKKEKKIKKENLSKNNEVDKNAQKLEIQIKNLNLQIKQLENENNKIRNDNFFLVSKIKKK